MSNFTTFVTGNPYIFETDTQDMGYEDNEIQSVEHACQLLINQLKEQLDPAVWDKYDTADLSVAERKQRIWEYLTIIDLLERKEDLTITEVDFGYIVYIPLIERLKAEEQQ